MHLNWMIIDIILIIFLTTCVLGHIEEYVEENDDAVEDSSEVKEKRFTQIHDVVENKTDSLKHNQLGHPNKSSSGRKIFDSLYRHHHTEDAQPDILADEVTWQKWSHTNNLASPPLIADTVVIGELKHHIFFYMIRSTNVYGAFCAGNIITTRRILTSAHCFLTNRKRYKRNLGDVHAVAGILTTVTIMPETNDEIQQWRKIVHLYSQKFYRFPAYNLAIVKVDRPFIFNNYVRNIIYGTKNFDYDGICNMTAVKTVTSWKQYKVLYIQKVKIIQKRDCEHLTLRCCRLYYCSAYSGKDLQYDVEIEGAGLICGGTGDPAEGPTIPGILVGITALMYVKLPTLHNRVSLFHQWITDGAQMVYLDLSKALVFAVSSMLWYKI